MLLFIDTDDEVTWGLRKSHNKALHDLYISPNNLKFINLITVIYKMFLLLSNNGVATGAI